MNVINEHIPRTINTSSMNEHHIKVKDEPRAKIEREILEFQAKGHAITHVPMGMGGIQANEWAEVLRRYASVCHYWKPRPQKRSFTYS